MAGIEPASERINRSDIYERSQLFVVSNWAAPDKSFSCLAAGSLRSLLAPSSGVIGVHSRFLSPSLLQREIEEGGRGYFLE